MSQRFLGRNVLITGGSRGIGFETARTFALEGAKVVIIASKPETLAKALQQFADENLTQVTGLVSDLEKLQDTRALFDEVHELLNHETVDILVNNAGVGSSAPLSEVNISEINRVFHVNVTVPLLLAQAFSEQFEVKSQQLGSIINISSIASRFDDLENVVYSVSKAAVNKLTRNLAKNLGKQGIRVNAVAPGSIDTDMTREKYSHPAVYQALVERLPLSRRGKPQDIAATVAFLASDEASYITGEVLVVDGGWLLQ